MLFRTQRRRIGVVAARYRYERSRNATGGSRRLDQLDDRSRRRVIVRRDERPATDAESAADAHAATNRTADEPADGVAKPIARAHSEPDAFTVAEPEPDGHAFANAVPVADRHAFTHTLAEPKPDSKSDAVPDSVTYTVADRYAHADANRYTDSDADGHADARADRHAVALSVTQRHAGSDGTADRTSNADTDRHADTRTDADRNADGLPRQRRHVAINRASPGRSTTASRARKHADTVPLRRTERSRRANPRPRLSAAGRRAQT
jgi:hypothetical protein